MFAPGGGWLLTGTQQDKFEGAIEVLRRIDGLGISDRLLDKFCDAVLRARET
jgi:hypothetical protein